MGKEVSVSETTPNPLGGKDLSSVTATTQANAILMGLQYSRTF